MSYIAEVLRRFVAQRADYRCEYCRIHRNDTFFSHEIDHIYAEKHGGETVETNLCLSCYDCNRYKGSDLCSLDPQNGEIVTLFHPRLQNWLEHFHYDRGLIIPITANARVVVKLLRLNDDERVFERKRLSRIGKYS